MVWVINSVCTQTVLRFGETGSVSATADRPTTFPNYLRFRATPKVLLTTKEKTKRFLGPHRLEWDFGEDDRVTPSQIVPTPIIPLNSKPLNP